MLSPFSSLFRLLLDRKVNVLCRDWLCVLVFLGLRHAKHCLICGYHATVSSLAVVVSLFNDTIRLSTHIITGRFLFKNFFI